MRPYGILILVFGCMAVVACGPESVDNAATAGGKGTDVLAEDRADLERQREIAVGGAFGKDVPELEWPREISHSKGTVVMYQPQIDSFSGNVLEGRAAVAVTPAGEDEPIFGAVWLRTLLDTDYDTRTATLASVEVPLVRFPETTPEKEQALAAFLEEEIESWEVELSLDRLSAAIGATEHEMAEARGLRNDPPRILVRFEPAVLIFIDGEPVFWPIEGSQLMEVANTPYLMFLDPPTGTYYLNAGLRWFAARDLWSPWGLARDTPEEILALTPEVEPEEEIEGVPLDDRTPEIVISTVPAELVFIDGEPELSPISGTDLMFVSNTDSDVLFEMTAQRFFVLLAGRWYEAADLEGPWIFVAPDELPEDFTRIPLDSENGHLLAHVAGTEMSRSAALDAEIPQTAAIPRDQTIEVTYDREPVFTSIEGTDMAYAVNADGFVVLLIEGRYYCCHEGVWYEASSETGPWMVCTSVPDAVQSIPPSSPVYHVKYVYVYSASPAVVYVGYTAGYTGTYVVNGCVVYGTGYTYVPYCATSCHTWPSTWGFHVRYNPYTGWTFGLSYSCGPFTFTVGRGWFGPRWYRPYPRHAYRAGYRAGYRRGYWHGYRHGHGHRPPGAHRPPHAHPAHRSNLYNRSPTSKGMNNSRGVQKTGSAPQARPAPNKVRANNVYTDRDGNVFRRDEAGNWQQRKGNSWQDSPELSGGNLASQRPNTAAARPADRSPGSQPNKQRQLTRNPQSRPQTTSTQRGGAGGSLNRDHQSRQRGDQRVQQYNASRQPSRSTKGKGGGGRRR